MRSIHQYLSRRYFDHVWWLSCRSNCITWQRPLIIFHQDVIDRWYCHVELMTKGFISFSLRKMTLNNPFPITSNLLWQSHLESILLGEPWLMSSCPVLSPGPFSFPYQIDLVVFLNPPSFYWASHCISWASLLQSRWLTTTGTREWRKLWAPRFPLASTVEFWRKV